MTSWDMLPTAMIAGAGAGDQRRSCFYCGEVGHFVRDCVQRVNRKSPRAAYTCFACGGPGHFARDCPNKFTPNRTRNHPGRPNRTAGISRAGGTSAVRGGTSAVRGEDGPNRTAGITRAVGTSPIGGEGGPNRTAGITRAVGTSPIGGGGEGGPNRTAGISRARYRSAYRARCRSAGRGEGGPNCTAGITPSGYTSVDGGGGGPNSITGITRISGTGAGGGEGDPNHTAGITRVSGTDGGEGGPSHTAGITQTRGMSAGGGYWIRRRELPADQSKDSSSINGGGIGGVPSLNQSSYFPRIHGGSGSSPNDPVNQTYKFFGSSGIAGDSNREYSNLLNISNGDCGECSIGSSKDSGEGSSARGLLNDISSSSSGNNFDDDDYKDFDMWLSRTSLSEGKIMEKRCGFVAKVSEGIDCERLSIGKYTSGKSFNNNGMTSRGPAVIDVSSSSSEDEEGWVVRKKTTGFLFPTGMVKEEIKRVVGDDDEDDDDDDDDDDCVILERNPFEPPTADFEQKVSLSEHKSSIVHDEDITVISERGQVACRDYPHSRHHCGKFPFSKTTHGSCCPQCYCYICEVVAPCEYWNGSRGHCHASDQDPIWGIAKKYIRNLRLQKIPAQC